MLQSEAFFSRKNAFGNIPKLLDILTSYSTDVIFHLWNGTLHSPTSSSAGGMVAQRMSRTAWIKWSDFYRCVVLHSGDRTPTLFNRHGTRTCRSYESSTQAGPIVCYVLSIQNAVPFCSPAETRLGTTGGMRNSSQSQIGFTRNIW